MSADGLMASLEAAGSALGAAGYAAYRLTLVGHAAPIANAYRDRVTHPQPGDLVMETSSFPWRDRKGSGHGAVGTLVRCGVEHIVNPPDEYEPEGWEYDELVWYVDPFTGGETVRWTNAEFIAIPRSVDETQEWGRPPA